MAVYRKLLASSTTTCSA